MSYGWNQAIAQMPPLGVAPDTLLARYADFLRCFGATEGEDAWVPDGSLEWTGAEGTAYWLRRAGGTLLVVSNLNPKPVEGTLRIRKPARVGLSPRTRCLAYRPDLRALVADIPLPGNELREFTFALKPYEPALLFLTPSDGAPRPLWASLSDGFREVKQAGRALTFTVAGAERGRSRVVVYAGRLPPGRQGAAREARRATRHPGGALQRAHRDAVGAVAPTGARGGWRIATLLARAACLRSPAAAAPAHAAPPPPATRPPRTRSGPSGAPRPSSQCSRHR